MTGPRPDKIIRFDDFEVDLERRRLVHGGETVALKSKAFDILAELIENRGELLTKGQLMDMVWEGQFVEENNLTVHIAALRKALGEKKGEYRYILTVPGKGYRFVAKAAPPEANDVIVEHHSFQRILIEEEIIDDPPEELTAAAETRHERLLTDAPAGRPRWLRWAAAVGSVLIVLVGAAVWISEYGAVLRPNAAAQVRTAFFATPGGVPQRVGISPDGNSIAYALRQNGMDSIWIGDLESGNSIQLIPPQERVYSYLGFDRKEKFLYFTVRDDEHPAWTLMRVSVFGGPAVEMAKGVHSSVAFSPDGTQMAFVRRSTSPDRTAMIVVDAETGKTEREIFAPEWPQRITGNGVSWSPDGESVAFTLTDGEGNGCVISSISLSGGSVARLSEAECNSSSNLEWRADGKGILLLVPGEENDDRHLSLIDVETGKAERLLDRAVNFSPYCLSSGANGRIALLSTRTDPEIRYSNDIDSGISRLIAGGSRLSREAALGLAVAPDGKIVFAAKKGDSRVLWEIDDQGAARQLTASYAGSDDAQVSVTPDDRFLIFESRRSGGLEIWRGNREGSGLVQLTNSGDNSEPTLTPDGTEIIYTSRRDGQHSLWRIPVSGGVPERISGGEGTWPSVSPDGKYIAYSSNSPTDSLQKEIRIIPAAGGAPLKTFKMTVQSIFYNRLRWAPDGRSIIYKDLISGLWKQDIDGGRPTRLPGFENFRVYHFAFAPDGGMAYSGGVQMREIVIAETPD